MRMKVWLAAALLLAAAPAMAQGAKALLNPNTASEAELTAAMTAPLAQAVIAKRPLAGPAQLDAVLAASAVNEGQRKSLYTRLFVPLNLNSATLAEIMLIPGMSPRMANEFREYRPYKSIGQFRYEIGKYVSKDEVARLERYVFVPGN